MLRFVTKVVVLRRIVVHRRVRRMNRDRMFFIQLYRTWVFRSMRHLGK